LVLILEFGKSWLSEKSTVKIFDAGFDVGEEVKGGSQTPPKLVG
jgi:hypothetical protein